MAVIAGAQGPRGDRGLQGPVGPRGLPGKDGSKGDRGQTGGQGQKGDRGDRGFKGERGATGTVGPRGVDGLPGRDGSVSGIERSSTPADVSSIGTPGIASLAAAADHVHKGLHSVRAEAGQVFGDLVLAAGLGISFSTTGNTITITSSGGGGGLTFASGLTNTTGTVRNDFFTGKGSSQTLYGGAVASGNLRISSTSDATKGSIFFPDLTAGGYAKLAATTGELSLAPDVPITDLSGANDKQVAYGGPSGDLIGSASFLFDDSTSNLLINSTGPWAAGWSTIQLNQNANIPAYFVVSNTNAGSGGAAGFVMSQEESLVSLPYAAFSLYGPGFPGLADSALFEMGNSAQNMIFNNLVGGLKFSTGISRTPWLTVDNPGNVAFPALSAGGYATIAPSTGILGAQTGVPLTDLTGATYQQLAIGGVLGDLVNLPDLTYDGQNFRITGTFAGGRGIFVENHDSGTGSWAELGLVNDLGESFRTSLYMTSSTWAFDGGANALIIQNAGGPIALQGAGTGSIGFTLTDNGPSTPGDVQIATLSAGGIVKAASTTGQLELAIGGVDYELPGGGGDHKVAADLLDSSPDYLINKLTGTVPAVINLVAGTGAPPATNLVAWFKADAGVTLSGSDVIQWNDQSGNGWHLTPDGGDDVPSFHTGIVNGLPGLLFDTANGNAQLANTAAVFGNNAPWYVVAIVMPTVPTVGPQLGGFTDGGPVFLVNVNSGLTFPTFGDFGGTVYVTGGITASGSITASTPYEVEWGSTGGGGTFTAFANGSALSLSSSVSGNDSGTGIYVGFDNGTGNGGFSGYVVELLVYGAQPSPTDLAILRGYLQTRSGITIAGASTSTADTVDVSVSYDNASIGLDFLNQLSLIGIPDSTPLAGDLVFPAISMPLAPSTGFANVWYDSLAGNLWIENEFSVSSHTAQSQTAPSHMFFNELNDDGSFSYAQVDFTDLSGNATLAQLPLETAHTLIGNPSSSFTTPIEMTLGAALAFVNHGGGSYSLDNTSPLSALAVDSPLNLSGTTIQVPGFLQANNGTPSATSLTGAANPTMIEWNITPFSAVAAATLHSVHQWDPVTITLTGGTHVTGQQLGLAYFKAPTITDGTSMTVDDPFTVAIAGPPVAAGSVTFGDHGPLSFWVQGGATQLDGSLAVNGVYPPTNVNLIIGKSIEANRDRTQFYLGGGSLGATGTGDDSLFEVIPSNTVVRPSVSGGVYAVNRFHTNSLSSAAATTISEAATVYIDGKPFIGTNVSITNASYALHVAGGTVRVDQLAGPGLVNTSANGTLGVQTPVYGTLTLGGYATVTTAGVYVGAGHQDVSSTPIEYPVADLVGLGATKFTARVIVSVYLSTGSLKVAVTANGVKLAETASISGTGEFSIASTNLDLSHQRLGVYLDPTAISSPNDIDIRVIITLN